MGSMKSKAALVVTVVLVSVLGLYGTAEAAVDHNRTISAVGPGGAVSWDGAPATGMNQDYDAETGNPCPETPNPDGSDYCEQALLKVSTGSPVGVVVRLENDPANDFDLFIYKSNSAGARGALEDSSANPQTLLEEATIAVAPNNSYWLIQVVYFQTTPIDGYHAEAEAVEGEEPPPSGGPDFAETKYYLHEDDNPALPPADPDIYNTTPPDADDHDPAIATDSALSPVHPQWEGDIGTASTPGTIRRFRVEFWMSAPVSNATANVDFDVTLIVGGRRFEFPQFTEPIEPETPTPQRVTHQFEPCTSNNPPAPAGCTTLLPLALPGGPVTFEIAGHFVDSQAEVDIYYDSAETPSNFVVNPPPLPGRAPFPPDVDVPPGLQEALASNPALKFTSHSEPHIAQSPLNPDILVAGSKMYNKDPDALAEYEFKIGTYVSFNGGRTWKDLGQLDVNTCPANQRDNLGPDAWPANVCYPGDNPTQEGPEENGEDISEEYITSDIWMQFDDEGNAYAMVLDHPPYDQAGEGNGWGMTTHTWKSVSPQDLLPGGQTWSHRHVINAYFDELGQLLLLDDKNTLAVNNAGPDKETDPTNIMVACWGQSASDPVVGAGKQQIVCERSTDQGETWPDQPTPVIDAEALVIGVHVVADTADPEKFYLTWNQYATGGGAGNLGGALTPETLEFAVSIDGGQTFERRPAPITALNGLPRSFPGQQFRNLTIPIMAVGPDPDGDGEEVPPLYIVYAEYRDAPDPDNDADKLQADIMFVKSTDGGITWSEPSNLTEDTGENTNPNADQFQPYIATTPSGQLNVAYFDRRLDVPQGQHAGNYFTDVFFQRSNDGGENWSDGIRLTHDMTDPEFSAPISPSGLFFGDYQGLVADDCVAVPFFNDTHRANDKFLDPGPVRDPQFDKGMDSSKYQEVVSWRVQNTAQFGGPEAAACPDLTLTPDDITASKPPRVGRTTKVTAVVHNIGTVDVSNVVVRFRLGKLILGKDQVVPSIPAGGTGAASILWTPDSSGLKRVNVIVDPKNKIRETNELNNRVRKVFTVLR